MYAMRDMSKTMESDRWFKSIPQDGYEMADGEVESPTGWFGIVVVDDSTRDYVGSETGDTAPASVEDGTYLVTIDNNGLVWAEQADTAEATRRNFHQKLDEYHRWLDQDED